MFVRYFTELPLSLDAVEPAFLKAPEDWIPGLAKEAQARGELLMGEVGFGSPGLRLSKTVEIHLGRPVRFPSKTVLPISWRPTTHESLFPALEADLEIAGLGRGRTQLSISARYQPPLGAFGRVMDRTVLHRVAEATLKDFVDQAAIALERQVAPALEVVHPEVRP